jgi:PAS domain S-box-containing protein
MKWLAAGVVYSLAYLIAGWALRGHAQILPWFRMVALLVPAMSGVVIVVRRRHLWTGCHWLFWTTIALGWVLSSLGLVGWTVDEWLLGRETSWLGWHAVFALFGGVAPLLALLTQPHRGRREAVTTSTAVDIAGIAVMAGFLYSRFVVAPDAAATTAVQPSLPLILLNEFQQFLAFVGMAIAAFIARGQRWGPTYRRLAVGVFVHFLTLTISSTEIWRGLYQSVFVYDLLWILPFAFYAWAAASAPASDETAADDEERVVSPARPWIVFGALALIPLADFGLQQVVPMGAAGERRGLFTVITVCSVLPLLMARLVVTHGEARQAESKRRLLAAATEYADDLITIMRTDGRMEHANGAFCRAVRSTPQDVAVRRTVDFLAEQSRSQIDAITDAIRAAGVWRGTLVRCRQDQSTFLSSATIVSLTDDAGAATHWVAIERDITQETQLREQQIHRERLAAIGQLVSGVAHELNNPLQSILGLSDLMIQSDRHADMRTDLAEVQTQAHRAAKIVRNLLAFVRRSGKQRTECNINEIVRSAVTLRERELELANIAVEEEYAPNPPHVVINREEMQQVVLNLIVNAEQALRAANSGGRLRVRTAVHESSVAVDVEDDGPGIPPALAGKIFEPFFSTKETGQGTGLGLSISLGIATAHGGSLVLVPSPRGACLRLSVPVRNAQPSPEPKASTAATWTAMTGRRALVVDDEPSLRDWLQRVLTRRGFAVDVADDGQSAIGLMERNRYDTIFCDVQMPRVGGADVYGTIYRRQPDLLPGFVFISGQALDGQVEWLVKTSNVPFLAKPFGEANVDAVLASVLAGRGPRREPRPA